MLLLGGARLRPRLRVPAIALRPRRGLVVQMAVPRAPVERPSGLQLRRHALVYAVPMVSGGVPGRAPAARGVDFRTARTSDRTLRARQTRRAATAAHRSASGSWTTRS